MRRKHQTQSITEREVYDQGETIHYTLCRKNVKNVNLRVASDGSIHVSANRSVPVSFIDSFVVSKGDFIKNAIIRQKNRMETEVKVPEYRSGDSFSYLGTKLRIEVVKGNKDEIKRKEDTLIFYLRDPNQIEKRRNLAEKWIRQECSRIFDEICHEVYPMFEPYGIAYPIIKLRKMTSVWGSCQYTRRIITLNTRLLHKPVRCIRYVVIHEFAHFIHPNHSKEFHAVVGKFMPDWKERKKELAYING